MKLYEINNEIENLLAKIEEECIDKETGEVFESELQEKVFKELSRLELERDNKIENIALLYKQINSDVTALKNEIDSFAKRKKTAENRADRLKNYLMYALTESDLDRFETPRCLIKINKSTEVAITNLDALEDDFKRVKVEVDKVAIRNSIKQGQAVLGAEIKERTNLTIK